MTEKILFDTDPTFVGPPRPLPRVAGSSPGDDGGGDAGVGAGDGGGGSAGDAGDGGDGGDPAGAVDLEAIAAEYDAEALADIEAADADGAVAGDKGEGKDGKPGARRTPPSGDPVDEFITKNYQGDRAAFVAGLHESRAEARRLADEVAVLRDRVANGGGTKPVDAAADFKAIRDADPDVQALDQEITQLAKDIKDVGAVQIDLLTRARKLEADINTVEAQLPHIEEPKEYNKLFNQLSRARTELAILNGEYNTNDSNVRAARFELRSLQREMRTTEQRLRERIDADDKSQKNTTRDMARTRATFHAAFDNLMEPFGLDKAGEKYVYVRETVRAQLADWLEAESAKNEDFDGLDAGGIYDAVNKLIGRYAKNNGMAPKRKAGAGPTPPNPQRRVMTPRAPARPDAGAGSGSNRGGRAPVRTTDDVLSDPDRIRERARRIDEAAMRASTGRRGLA